MLPETPALAVDFLRQATRGELSMNWHSADLDRLRRELRRSHRRLLLTVIGGGLLILAAMLTLVTSLPSWSVAAAGLLAGSGLLTLIVAGWRRRS